MFQAPRYHFTINSQSDLLADAEVWDAPLAGVFEPGHMHSYYEILIFRKGGGTHQMGTDVFEVADGSIHILQTNQFHELRRTPETDGFEIIFSEVFLNQLQQFDPNTAFLRYFSKSRVLNLSTSDFNALGLYFDELLRNKSNKSIFYNLVSLILLKIIDAGKGEDQRCTADAAFQKSVLTLLNRHYKEKPNMDFYASRLNMTLATFQRHMKSAFGRSMMELQNEKIIQEVRFLLSQDGQPIKRIVYDFNFTDEAHFNHFFRKHVGLSPSAYRKSCMA